MVSKKKTGMRFGTLCIELMRLVPGRLRNHRSTDIAELTVNLVAL